MNNENKLTICKDLWHYDQHGSDTIWNLKKVIWSIGIVIRTVVASIDKRLTRKTRRKISRVMEALSILIEVLGHRYNHLPKLTEATIFKLYTICKYILIKNNENIIRRKFKCKWSPLAWVYSFRMLSPILVHILMSGKTTLCFLPSVSSDPSVFSLIYIVTQNM